MNIQLKIVNEKSGPRYLAIDGNGSIFTISEIMYLILKEDQKHLPVDQIADVLNQKFDCNKFTGSFVQEVIETARLKISTPGQIEKLNSKYVFFNRVIIPEGSFSGGYRILSKLFNKILFLLLSSLSILLTALFFFRTGAAIAVNTYHEIIGHLSVVHILLFYASFILIVIMHELGHASASYRFGVMPKEIGLGLYFILPVFYTNVTGIWGLNTRRRIVVNLGGIYFQLIINLVLLGLLYTELAIPFCFSLLVANTISLLSALNPFFRYDGYWIYSDLFQLPNLKKQTQSFLLTRLFNKTKADRGFNWSLCLYSIGNMLFWVLVYYNIGRALFTIIPRLYAQVTGNSATRAPSVAELVFSFAITIVFLLILTNFITRLFKNISYEIKHIHQQA